MTREDPAEAAVSAERTPRFACDLILKGGITSGIVYPPAIAEIARDHRFHSIGGASAGAIGAASAAAAELGRDSRTGGFELLRRIPDQLAATDESQQTVLRRLFQPQPATRELFDLIWLVRGTSGRERVKGVLARLSDRGSATASWLWLGFAFTVAVAVLAVLALVLGDAWSLLVSVPLVGVALASWFAAWKLGKLYDGARTLAATAPHAVAGNLHGLCSGSTPDGSGDIALTDWLYQTLQALAGRDDEETEPALRGTPVTYGDLRRAGIELVTITTDISHGTSERFPLRSGGWAFSESDMRALFPDPVVDHLIASAPKPEDDAQREALARDGLHLLPEADEIPIILGARISLSFPILLSAVPLYAWRPVRAGDGWQLVFNQCWFSDGGITSNLPVHLFDRPLPTRPTYAINLGGGADPSAGPWGNIWRPLESRGGRLPSVGAITSTTGFLSAVFDTMQNWADNSLARAPGQRDRICKVRLGSGEGGMNLDMPAETISALVERGQAAGENLAWMQRGERPSGAPPDGVDPEKAARQWDRHRFTRYRTFLAALGRHVEDARKGAGHLQPGRPSYDELAAAAVTEKWFPYRTGWSGARREKVATAQRGIFATELDALTATPPAGAALGPNPDAPDPPAITQTA